MSCCAAQCVLCLDSAERTLIFNSVLADPRSPSTYPIIVREDEKVRISAPCHVRWRFPLVVLHHSQYLWRRSDTHRLDLRVKSKVGGQKVFLAA